MIRAVKDAESLLEAGFTTVRDAGGNKSIYLRQASEEGTIKAPRIISSHKVICITGGHYDLHFLPLEIERKLETNFRLADGPSDCRRAVREQVREAELAGRSGHRLRGRAEHLQHPARPHPVWSVPGRWCFLAAIA